MLTISFRGELLLTRRLEVTSVQLGQREHGDHYRERVATEITRSLDIFDRQRLSVGVGELLLAPLPQDPELEQFSAQQALTCRSCPPHCRKSWILRTPASPLPRSSGSIFTCSARLRVEEKAL